MSLKLVDAIQQLHRNDIEFMELLDLTPSYAPDEIIKRITKGMEPEVTLSKNTLPHVCIYVVPGRFGRNQLVFEGKFCVDFFGQTAYEAKTMFERSFTLLHDQRIKSDDFHSYLCVLAYDTDFATGIRDVKGYRSIYDVDYLR